MIPKEVFPTAIFYQLPLYSCGDDYYIRTSDIDDYLREYYFVISVYGSLMYLYLLDIM